MRIPDFRGLQLPGDQHEVRQCFESRLGADILDMLADGPWADSKIPGYFFGCQAEFQLSQDLFFTIAQAIVP